MKDLPPMASMGHCEGDDEGLDESVKGAGDRAKQKRDEDHKLQQERQGFHDGTSLLSCVSSSGFSHSGDRSGDGREEHCPRAGGLPGGWRGGPGVQSN